MSEHRRETAFLRHCLRYGDSARHQALDKRIAQIQGDERCVQRAVWLMAVLMVLAVAGLSYATVLVDNFPYNMSQHIINTICALGVGSLISLLAFVSLRKVYRMKLDRRREECRQLVTKLLESRLGKPVRAPWRESRVCDGNRESVPVAAGGNGSPDQTESIALG